MQKNEFGRFVNLIFCLAETETALDLENVSLIRDDLNARILHIISRHLNMIVIVVF